MMTQKPKFDTNFKPDKVINNLRFFVPGFLRQHSLIIFKKQMTIDPIIIIFNDYLKLIQESG